jgi:hypothetical protein
MKLGNFLILTSSLLALIACGGGSGSSGGSGKAEATKAADLGITKEEVILRVGGICGKNRYYRVLETELIPQDDGNTAVGQLILLEDGTYTIVAETFSITQKGPELYNYTRGKERIAQGKWSIEGGRIKTEQGTLEKVLDKSPSEGDEYYEFTDSSDEHARKLIFRTINKVSEQYIPTKYGCPNQQDLIAHNQSGKFALFQEEEIGLEHIFRNTPDRWKLEDLMSGNYGSHSEDNYYCKAVGQTFDNCQTSFSFDTAQSGSILVWNSNVVGRKIGVKMRVDDFHFELTSENGSSTHLIPESGVGSFYLEETEEFFYEL